MGAFSKDTQRWLDAVAALERGSDGSRATASSAAEMIMEDSVFSSFSSTYDCDGETVEKKTWIEPLSHGLRHPRALCGGGADLVDRDYLLLSSRDDFFSSRGITTAESDHAGGGGLPSSDESRSNTKSTRDDASRDDASRTSSKAKKSTRTEDARTSNAKSTHAAASLLTSSNAQTAHAAADSVLASSKAASRHRHNLGGACVKRPCQSIFVDLGASTWNTGFGGPSQSWFYESYKRHGLEFDRLLMWEAEPTPVSDIFSALPKDLWHKYQYFNWPASSNSSDPSSPLRIIRTIAEQGDFVVLKLDIDTPAVEMAILRELLRDPELLDLVDEFFFEYHVLFAPMNNAWFKSENPSPPPTRETLADSYKLFRTLREKGLRAHSWV